MKALSSVPIDPAGTIWPFSSRGEADDLLLHFLAVALVAWLLVLALVTVLGLIQSARSRNGCKDMEVNHETHYRGGTAGHPGDAGIRLGAVSDCETAEIN